MLFAVFASLLAQQRLWVVHIFTDIHSPKIAMPKPNQECWDHMPVSLLSALLLTQNLLSLLQFVWKLFLFPYPDKKWKWEKIMLLRGFKAQVFFQILVTCADSSQPQPPDAVYSTRAERGNNQRVSGVVQPSCSTLSSTQGSHIPPAAGTKQPAQPSKCQIRDTWGRHSYEKNSGKISFLPSTYSYR